MSKSQFSCEACGRKAERLALRNSDGLWVCPPCVPKKEWAELEAGKRLAEKAER